MARQVMNVNMNVMNYDNDLPANRISSQHLKRRHSYKRVCPYKIFFSSWNSCGHCNTIPNRLGQFTTCRPFWSAMESAKSMSRLLKSIVWALPRQRCPARTTHTNNHSFSTIIIIIITTLFQSQSNRYEGQQVHIIYTEPVLARRPEQPVTNNKV